jgi:hypothetical protein
MQLAALRARIQKPSSALDLLNRFSAAIMVAKLSWRRVTQQCDKLGASITTAAGYLADVHDRRAIESPLSIEPSRKVGELVLAGNHLAECLWFGEDYVSGTLPEPVRRCGEASRLAANHTAARAQSGRARRQHRETSDTCLAPYQRATEA